jgi:spermidine synthase
MEADGERAAPRGFLLAALGASGAAVMCVEMTAVRALQPWFGSTTHVWTHVIAVVLAALAAGGYLGGLLADRRPSTALLSWLLVAGGLLVAATSPLVSPVARLFLREGVDPAGLASLLARGSLGTTLLLFAPPLLVLGAVAPVGVRLLAAGGVGRAAGTVFAVSTAGSIAGTYLPTLLLVPRLGTRGTLLAAAGLLVLAGAAGLALFARPRRAGAAAAGLVLLAGIAAPAMSHPVILRPPPGDTSTLLAERESPYQYLAVRDDRVPGEPVARVLTINEGVHAFHSLRVEGRALSGSRAHDDHALLPLLLDLAPGQELRVAVVGFACGVNAAQWRHFWDGLYRLRVDGAELDPGVLDLGREYFGLTDSGPAVAAADGRPWLASLPTDARYHALVLDAFAQELYVPFHLGTREFFELCRRRLEPGGVLAMNVFAAEADAPNLRAIENTLAAVFGSCVRARQADGENHLLLARNGTGPPDLARLDTVATLGRFGERPEVAEWRALLRNAADLPRDAVVVAARDDAPVLTDDHAPLEWLTDRFLRDRERDTLASPAGDPVRALRGRQDRLLAGIAAGWILALGGAFAFLARRTGAPLGPQEPPG